MVTKNSFLWGLPLLCVLAVTSGASFADQKIVDADTIKALITGKTVSVTHERSGNEWKMYFSPEGKSIRDNGDEADWRINSEGQHCNTGVPLECAKVADLGNGTYARIKPNGDIAVIWTKIEDGKHL